MNDRWLPALIIVTLMGVMCYAIGTDIRSPQPATAPGYRGAEVAGSERNNNQQRAQEQSMSLGDIAALVGSVATLMVAGATLFLVRVTGRSVRVAERALNELEAPAVFVSFKQNGLRWRGDNTGYVTGELHYRFVNYGRTPAIITHYMDTIEPRRRATGNPAAVDPNPIFRENRIGYGFVVPPNGGESDKITLNIIPHRFTEAGELYNDPDTAVFFFIHFRYTDALKQTYAAGFMFLYVAAFDQWSLTSADGRYNYCRKIKTENA